MAKVGVVTVAYRLAEATDKLLASLKSKRHELEVHLFLHSRQSDVVVTCQKWRDAMPNLHYYPYGCNRGLSRSWNEGILKALQDGLHL